MARWDLRIKDTLEQSFHPYSLQRDCPLGGPTCIGSIGRKCFGISSCVVRREVILISECPLSEIAPHTHMFIRPMG